MPLQPVPYLMVSQDIDVAASPGGESSLRVYVCINLLDHRAVGIAATRERALRDMNRNFAELNGDAGPADSFGGDGCLN